MSGSGNRMGKGSMVRGAALAVVAAMVMASPLEAATILFDFGRNTLDWPTKGNWNNLASDQTTAGQGTGGTGVRITDAIDDAGVATGVSLEITDDFSRADNGGVTTNVATLGKYPLSAQRDSFMVERNNGAQIKLAGLTVGQAYDFTFFGSKSSGYTDSRAFTVKIGGATETLETLNNVSNTVSIKGVAPDDQGSVVIDITTSAQWGYFGVMEVTAVPEPTAAMSMGLVVLACVHRRRR